MSDTIPNRPGAMPNRPKTGLAAWEATVGYIAVEHNPDALLTLRAYPTGEDDLTAWGAALEWGKNAEQVTDMPTLADALRQLWKVVDQGHVIFLKTEDAIRKPSGYTEFDWLDPDTRDALDRLTWVLRVVFNDDWMIIIIYRPVDNPDVRVQMRLIAQDDSIHIGGRGASVRDAATQLYRNATPYFSGARD